MMKEELTTHDVEWEVMSGPGQEEKARRLVETRPGSLKRLVSYYNDVLGRYLLCSRASIPRRKEN